MSNRRRAKDSGLLFVYDRVCTQDEKEREMSREYGWPDLTLKEENILVFRDSQNHELEDIRTDQDEGIAADFLFKTLRDLMEEFPETPVVASIAGGRKTMSYLMGSVMSILGRRDDELTHVLVDPRYEAIDTEKSGGQFFYRTKNSRTFYTRQGEKLDGAAAEVELSSIPFIRMGHFLKDSRQWSRLMASGNRDNIYSEAINYINSEMTVSPEDVYVTLDWQNAALDIEVRKDIRPARYRAELTPIQFAFYALILCYRKNLAQVFGDNGSMLAESGNLPTPPNKQMVLLQIGKELKTLFQNWLYLFSLLPADPFADAGKECRAKLQRDVAKIINGVNRNFAAGKMGQDAYTLEEPIETIACEEPLWGAFEGVYDAVFYVWEKYKNEAFQALMDRFNYDNVMQVPKLEKITINIGLGEAKENAKLMEGAVEELGLIAGQRPVVTKARKSIANFKVRQGMPVGTKVTLRGDNMYVFADKFFNVALPRVRDFKGVSRNAFDGRGNYSMGIKEQLVFPEINYDKVDTIKGMNVVFTTTAKTDEEAAALLELLGMPFEK